MWFEISHLSTRELIRSKTLTELDILAQNLSWCEELEQIPSDIEKKEIDTSIARLKELLAKKKKEELKGDEVQEFEVEWLLMFFYLWNYIGKYIIEKNPGFQKKANSRALIIKTSIYLSRVDVNNFYSNATGIAQSWICRFWKIGLLKRSTINQLHLTACFRSLT